MPTLLLQKRNADGTIEFVPMDLVETSSGDPALLVSHPDAFAHEQNAGQSNQIGASIPKSNLTVLGVTTAVAVALGADAQLLAIHNTSAAAVVATIIGLFDEDGTAAVAAAQAWSIPANGSREFKGAQVGSTFTIAAATADVLVVEWWSR